MSKVCANDNVPEICQQGTTFGLNVAKSLQSLIEEISDVMCMIELLVERGCISKTELNNGSQLKKLKLIKYSNIFGDYNEK